MPQNPRKCFAQNGEGGLLREGRQKYAAGYSGWPQQCPDAWESSGFAEVEYLIVHKVVGFKISSLSSSWWLHRNHSTALSSG